VTTSPATRTARLRAATAADVAAVAAIEAAVFSDAWTRASFAQLLGNAAVTFLVAERAEQPGVPVGYVVAWFAADEAEIANLAVAETARGTGLGARLLDAALAEAWRRGVNAVFLEVRESNAPARALYASRGFGAVGRRRNYYRRPLEDALVLRLDLDAEPHAGG
jgi:ribosomal-protein-alanine N-acetyltransferase